MNNLGKPGEDKAESYLRKNGYKICERNYRSLWGEIDIIAITEKVICFIEVRFRQSAQYGHPFETVNIGKQRKIIKTAEFYLMRNKWSEMYYCRFDIIAISADNNIVHLKNAFQSN